MLDAIDEDVNAGVTTQDEADASRKLFHVNVRNANGETEDPAPKVLSKEEHIQHHLVLHAALDELTADWLQHNRGKTLSGTSILTLMEWSFAQTREPTP